MEDTPLERFEQFNHLLFKKGYGGACFIYLFVTKSEADNIRQLFDRGHIDQDGVYSRLTGVMHAVKIKDTSDGNPDDLSDELAALHHTGPMNHPNLVQKLSGNSDGEDSQFWYELEAFGGGTLNDLTQYYRGGQLSGTPPVSFGFHLIHQLSEALLAFQFGAPTNIDPIADWPLLYHDDVRPSNMLFRNLSDSKGYTSLSGYPDVVLCDFGEARTYAQIQDPTFFERQYNDVKTMLAAVEGLFQICSSQDPGSKLVVDKTRVLSDNLDGVKNTQGVANYNSALIQFLKATSKEARDLRTQHAADSPETLHAQTVDYFNKPIVGDREREEIMNNWWANIYDDHDDGDDNDNI